MDFSSIDQEVDRWVERHKLTLDRSYKDEEVRSVTIVTGNGASSQIWIEKQQEEWLINCWNFADKHVVLSSDELGIGDKLEKAYLTAKSWMAE